MPVTIRDVAKAAGCSPMAVSKVLHGRGGTVRVGAERAEHIRKIAAELNYVPNQIARALRGERRFNIGLIMDSLYPMSIGSRYLAHLYDGMQSASFKNGYSLTICPKLHTDHKRFLADGRFDGVVWAKYVLDPETINIANRFDIKIVHLHVPPHLALDDQHDYFCCRNREAMILGVKHLFDLGHRRIDFGMDADNIGSAEDADRWGGFQDACHSLGIPVGGRYEMLYTNEDARKWLTAPGRGTGIVLRTENLAERIILAGRELGLEAPRDYSVVGFDSTAFCDTLSPKLTAIKQPIEQMAYDAVEVLIRRIEGKPVDSTIHLYDCGFDVRESTGPPPTN